MLQRGYLLFALLLTSSFHCASSFAGSFLGTPGTRHPSLTRTKRITEQLSQWTSSMGLPQTLVSNPRLPNILDFRSSFSLPSLPKFERKQQEVVANLEKAAVRKHLEADAQRSSMVVIQLYFQTLRMKEDHKDEPHEEILRLARSCPSLAEIDRKSFIGNDCVICKGDVCELADNTFEPALPTMKGVIMDLLNELSHGHRALAGFSGKQKVMEETEIDKAPMEVSWHQSLSTTLSILGVRNRMDSTTHEGTHYMDVVAEQASNPHLAWGAKRGLIIQLLSQSSLRGESDTTNYVKIKTEAILKGQWNVLSVPWHEWSSLSSEDERIAYLAVKLAMLRLYSSAGG